jgi:hypothetical protein
MHLLKKILERMEFIVNKTKSDIFKFFHSGKENSKGSDFLNARIIDFDEVEIKDDQIEISRKPKFTSPFRPYGKIIISISKLSDDKSRLIGKILPYNGTGLNTIMILLTFLILFSITSLFISHNSNTILIIVLAWLMVGIGIFFEYFNSKSRLTKYLKEIIDFINIEIKASR